MFGAESDEMKPALTILVPVAYSVVIMILAAAIWGEWRSRQVRIHFVEQQISSFQMAVSVYRMHTGENPPTQVGLDALVTNLGIEGWAGPYLEPPAIPTDPWRTPYRYQIDGNIPVITSAGPDQKFGTKDDIHS